MPLFRKIGVFLDGSVADEEAVHFANAICESLRGDGLQCIHIRSQRAEVQGVTPTVDEFKHTVLDQLSKPVADRATFEVHEGTGIAEVLRISRDHQLDLIVAGRRLPTDELSIGSAFSRLARKAPCSVLVVPVHARVHLDRLLVPVDFSEHSRLALDAALEIARASHSDTPQIVVQNVYSVGYGYHYTGTGFHEAGQKLEAISRERLGRFVEGVAADGIQIRTITTCSDQPAAAIRDLTTAMKMDLIVVGSRGKTNTAAMMLGSTTERILMHSAVPVLIIKRKGETTHLLEALLGS
jgi:nucleotide-binding universal stress UspA family protein